MDESNLGHNGRNGHPFLSHNFQFSRPQQTQDNRYSSALNESCLPPTDMTLFDTGYSPHVGTASEQFAMSEFGGAPDAVSSAYGTNNTINKWQAAGPGSVFETASTASTVANLAVDFDRLGAQQSPSESRYPPSESRYAQSEAGSTRRRQSHKARRRHHSHQTAAAAANSTAGLGTVNDMHSTGAPSEQGENDLAAYSIELTDGYFECNICHEIKKPKCDMLKHINTHIRPYKCNHNSCKQSTKGFGTKNDLERHQRIHTDTKYLSRVYICSHGKCGLKTKLWPRWDNLKTHLRDVHRIKDPVKDDYHKENPAAQNQMLAGMVHTDRFSTSITTATPADAMPIVEELNTGDILRFEQSATLPFFGSQSDRFQALDQIHHAFGGNGGNPQRRNMGNGQFLSQLHGTNATTAAVGCSNANAYFSPQSELGLYPSISSGYSTNLIGLPESATASFPPQLGSHTPMQNMQQDMSFLASPPRRESRSQGHAPPFASHQTTPSVHSFTSVNEIAFSNAGHSSSLTSFAAASLPPTVESYTTSKMADAVENTFGDYSQDIVMNDVEPEADGHISLDSTRYIIPDIDLAEDGAGLGSDSDSTSVKSAENAGNAATEVAGLDSNNSLDDSLVSGISGTIDSRNDNASHIDQGQSASFAPPHSPTAVSPSAIILSNSADSGTNNQVSEVEAPENATAIPVEHPNATPASGLEATLEYLKNCSEDAISKVLEAIPETVALRNLRFEIRPIEPAQPQSASPTPADPPKGGSSSKRHQCPASGCNASFDSSSGLKKHEIRHKRPFGCTYGCTPNNKPQTFGSKNDWKRHEESFHLSENKSYMKWQCDVETAGKTACRKLFHTSESFQTHLLDKHEMREKSKKSVQERLVKCCLITVDEAKYWCGFCKTYLACMADSSGSTSSAVTAGSAADTSAMPPNTVYYSRLLSSRFNHIDNHFSGRGYKAVTIEDWVTSAEHEKATSAIRGATRPSRQKREPVHTRNTRDSLPSPKYLRNKPRSVTDYQWQCCRCGQMCSRLATQCSDCSVRSCDECRYEPIISIEQ